MSNFLKINSLKCAPTETGTSATSTMDQGPKTGADRLKTIGGSVRLSVAQQDMLNRFEKAKTSRVKSVVVGFAFRQHGESEKQIHRHDALSYATKLAAKPVRK
ncbi:MAG: hypothetical protein H7315_07720 [Herminiimonas sp.]|nr:hypothetical protein [Herminiimonas sp.]